MPNPEHLAILKEGVAVWNAWRKEHPEVQPDLEEADLVGANLTGALLFMADLSRANLSKATLSNVNLCGTNLSNASLAGANVVRASLGHMMLNRKTVFRDSNLKGTAGLSEAFIHGTIDLDVQTIYNSWPLPEHFLKAGGYDPAVLYKLLGHPQPIQFYDCFLSYSTKNEAFARRLFLDLTGAGVSSFFAPEDIKIGDKIRLTIDEAIRVRDKLLLVLSKHSLDSEWVAYEVETALQEELEKGKLVLFPIRLDDHIFETDVGWAQTLRQRHIGDFCRWKDRDAYRQGFERLLRDLKAS